MSTSQKTIRVLYTDTYDGEEAQWVRKEITEGTDEEFETIRAQINDLSSIHRKDLANLEIERFIQDYTASRSRDDWEDIQAEMNDFDEKRKNEFSGYIILPDVGSWSGRQSGIPMRFRTLNDCISRITNVKFMYELTIKDVDGRLKVVQAHHDSTNYFDIVELADDTYRYEEEDEEGSHTETADIDDDYLYRLGHPDTDGTLMDALLRDKCREVCFWRRYFNAETVPDEQRRIGTCV